MKVLDHSGKFCCQDPLSDKAEITGMQFKDPKKLANMMLSSRPPARLGTRHLIDPIEERFPMSKVIHNDKGYLDETFLNGLKGPSYLLQVPTYRGGGGTQTYEISHSMKMDPFLILPEGLIQNDYWS